MDAFSTLCRVFSVQSGAGASLFIVLAAARRVRVRARRVLPLQSA